jgi:hypothetical protein
MGDSRPSLQAIDSKYFLSPIGQQRCAQRRAFSSARAHFLCHVMEIKNASCQILKPKDHVFGCLISRAPGIPPQGTLAPARTNDFLDSLAWLGVHQRFL